jgi:hypothetical protein
MENKKPILLTVTSYFLWALLSAGTIFLLLSCRHTFLAAFARYSSRGFTEKVRIDAIDKFLVVFLGIIILASSIFIEYHLGKARSWTSLFGRFLMWLGIETGVLTVNTLVIQISSRLFLSSPGSAFSFFLPLVGALLSFAGFYYLKSHKPTRSPEPQQ